MLTLTSLDELKEAKKALSELQVRYPALYEKLVHVVGFTRALQFKYQYMGSLLMDEEASRYTPSFVQGSVLRLYKKELQNLKDDIDFPVIKRIFSTMKSIGYSRISLLILGKSPETIVGAPIIK
ncbi:hypothetical protein [Heyndrickxia camelliae]|uniref:Uncharacterized protein n=1 Tax=Heyndrickxia camelliae TaxID=1707093 RepID=A0A2N3LKE9_9BACI|nr:hypothetical protein [Heyndrickxia camelliae]PKR85029.1 hypothetical protein CWO92_11750 [Heyndrickxia camelliae]